MLMSGVVQDYQDLCLLACHGHGLSRWALTKSLQSSHRFKFSPETRDLLEVSGLLIPVPDTLIDKNILLKLPTAQRLTAGDFEDAIRVTV